MGLGAPQVDTRSRRHLLAELIHRKEADLRQKKRREEYTNTFEKLKASLGQLPKGVELLSRHRDDEPPVLQITTNNPALMRALIDRGARCRMVATSDNEDQIFELVGLVDQLQEKQP
jgi:HSP90 family molecular chaperone